MSCSSESARAEFTPMQEYYFITVFERLDITDLGWPCVGCERCWGFYTDKNTAFRAVHDNWTDMEETIYEYAVIEEYHEGISNFTGYRQFFRFDRDKDGYVEIDEPEAYKHFCSFAIG